MPARPKNQALTYVRRSTHRQETGIHEQLAWAMEEAKRLGVRLDAAPADLDHMVANRLVSFKGIYLDDGISGSDLNRPGFVAFRRDARARPHVSHLFVHMSDRFSRPELAIQAMQLEIELLLAGLTIVFHNRVSEPRERGIHYFEKDILLLFEYTQNGEFLTKLSVRVVQTQLHLSRQGFRTGGFAPYGFIRILVDSQGHELQELPRGTTMRREGCHVRLKPKDLTKIQTWLYILHLYGERHWGLHRIAEHLNDLGIPSPQDGYTRRRNGRPVMNSGQWSQRTVARLIEDATIIGLEEFGRRPSGKHRRWSPEGPRILADSDRSANGTPKTVRQASEDVIVHEGANSTGADPALFQSCQNLRAARRSQRRYVTRCSDPARYPLATRIHDLSKGCGQVLYGRPQRGRGTYLCSRYMRSGGRKCFHNSVDAEAALRFVLEVLRHGLDGCGGRVALRARLQQLAEASGEIESNPAVGELELTERHLATLEAEARTIARNLARAGEDESIYAAIKAEFKANEVERRRVQQKLGQQEQQATTPARTPDEEVEAAMKVLDDVERIASDPSARAEIPQLLRKLNLHLWLNFGQIFRGKRSIRGVTSGILTLGNLSGPPKGDASSSSREPDTDGHPSISPGSFPSFAPYDSCFTIGTSGEPEA